MEAEKVTEREKLEKTIRRKAAEILGEARPGPEPCLDYTSGPEGGRCWEQGVRVTMQGRQYTASDIVAHATFGPKPEGAQLCHRCDRRKYGCISPACLYYGTASDNARDRSRLQGDPRQKLGLRDRQRIRELVKEGRSAKEVALRFGVTDTTIRNVVSYRTGAADRDELEGEVTGETQQTIGTGAATTTGIERQQGAGGGSLERAEGRKVGPASVEPGRAAARLGEGGAERNLPAGGTESGTPERRDAQSAGSAEDGDGGRRSSEGEAQDMR